MTTERRKRISDDARWLAAQKIDVDNVGPSLPFDSYAELLAYQAELCRAGGHDEGEIIETLLIVAALSKEDLVEAEAELAPLGYTAISAVLRRLARRARPKRQFTFPNHTFKT